MIVNDLIHSYGPTRVRVEVIGQKMKRNKNGRFVGSIFEPFCSYSRCETNQSYFSANILGKFMRKKMQLREWSSRDAFEKVGQKERSCSSTVA